MKAYPHWQNLSSKLEDATGDRLELLQEIKREYRNWRQTIQEIEGTEKEDIVALTESYNGYKNFIQEPRFDEFDRRGRLHSTALEEFQFHLFRNLVEEVVDDEVIESNIQGVVDSWGESPNEEKDEIVLEQQESKYLGKGDNTLDSISVGNLIKEDDIDLAPSTTNQDFVIGREISTDGANFFLDPDEGDYSFVVPAVIIECKEYFDKTMTRRAIEEAAGLTDNLTFQPQFYLVSEYVKVNDLDLLAGSDVENMYVLRKQQQRDLEIRRDDPEWPEKRNDIDTELVWHLFESVEKFLKEDSTVEILEKGRYY
ncbi:MAG: Bpu10I family restriction endonuclease [Halobacteriaceae archaeon]